MVLEGKTAERISEMKNLPKFHGLTSAQKRDFIAYCSILRTIKVGQVQELNTDQPATSLAHWFWLWDTHGIRAPYRNQALCWRLVQSKAQLNLSINMWIEDALNPEPVTFAAEIKQWCEYLPQWVWKSYVRNFSRMSDGIYVPSFANPNSV